MDKDKELAGKVDALLGKHGKAPAHAAAGTSADHNIPLLTDVVDAPAWQPATKSAVLAKLGDAELDALSHDIFNRVISRIDQRLAIQLEERLTAQLTTQINIALTSVLTDMHQVIANEIGDAVNAALADHVRKK